MKKQHERISAEEANRKANASEALLVCAYEEDEQFKKMKLHGAISYRQFKNKVIHLPKNQEIIFYCSSAQEEDAAVRAQHAESEGFHNVKILGQGLKAWRKAGYRVEDEGS